VGLKSSVWFKKYIINLFFLETNASSISSMMNDICFIRIREGKGNVKKLLIMSCPNFR